jgi:mannose-1-phosphate guanylyltransferase
VLYALILAGGKGVRLYPLSREKNPKQFLKVVNDKSFLRSTVDRIKPIVPSENIFVVTNKEYLPKICEEIPEINKKNIFAEPSNKETATCIALSAVKLLKKDKDAVMIVLPSDHYIEGEKTFRDTINSAVEIAERRRGLVTIGVEPSRPETGYGYIEMGERIIGEMASFKVERFTEKPNIEVAKDFLLKGTYLWNSGMFVWRADVFIREMEKYLPKMHRCMMSIYQSIDTEAEESTIKEQYELIDGISVDFGIMQKTRKGFVIKCEFTWDDIGTFASLGRFLANYRGNNISGKVYTEGSENCTIFAGERLVIGFGLKDIVIVDSGDVLLVMDKNKDQEIKHLVTGLKEELEFIKYL